MRLGNWFQTSFYFLNYFRFFLVNMRYQQVVCSLASMHFDSSQLKIQQKTSYIKLQAIDPDICSISILQKRVWDQFLYHIFCMNFQEICFLCYFLLTDQIASCLIAFISHVGQYVYLDCLLARLWCHKFKKLTLSF